MADTAVSRRRKGASAASDNLPLCVRKTVVYMPNLGLEVT